ncbi:MAG: ABC transporter substrate-binding protein [Rhodothermaceae bacterium]|nr:MAG: ABC transporter substrate-binding protein [Rhodothermaceae bacterium]
MKRRDFVLKAAAGAAATGLLAGCGNRTAGEGGTAAVQTRPRVTWRLVSSFPRSLDTIFGAAEVLAERVRALTEDRFRIRVYPAGEIVPFDQVLESVQKGTVQMGHAASYYFIGKNPALAFDCTVPFGLTARQYNAWLYHGDGLSLTRALFADFNVLNFPGGNTGVQMGGWFRREINSLRDLRGLKMRIPGLGGRVMDRLGVTVQVLAGGDIYPALERGAIDATEWVGPYDDEKLGFHEVARYYYYPGWWEPGPALTFYVNRQAWEGLPGDYRHALEAAAAEANVNMLASYDAKNPPALRRLLEQGVQLRRFPDDVMQAAYQEAVDLMEEQAAADATYRKVYESYKAWRADAYRWFDTAEQAYAAFAFRQPFT